MNRRLIIRVAIGAAVVFALPMLPHVLEDVLPFWLVAPLAFASIASMVLLAPMILLAAGWSGAACFITIVALVAACLWLTKYFWRRYPHSEEFVVPLIAAAVLWLGSPLLLIWLVEI